MPFKLLKYLQPTDYFQLKRNDGTFIFPIPEGLPKDILNQLTKRQIFDSVNAQRYDLSWQAIKKGYIEDSQTFESFYELSLIDNYRFIRLYFHHAWVLYVLVVRILSFKNPLKEVAAWKNSLSVKRDFLNPIYRPTDSLTKDNLIFAKPFISVIIPTLNRYSYLNDVLKDLEKQTYTDFEVVVVDQSEQFNPDFYKDFKLNIRLIHQKEKALWLARNTAIKESKGAFIALSEDDIRIGPDWLQQHIKCLDYFNADISAGVFYPLGKSIPKDRDHFQVANQFATGNALLKKSVFRKVGLFDRQFEKQRMGDGEFGLRCYLAGFKSVSNPKANCVDIKADSGGLREMGSWDAYRPSNFLSPRPIPSVIYFYRRYFGNRATKLSLLRTVPTSIIPYQFKKNRILLLVAAFFSILLSPLILYQVYRSNSLAEKKLKSGPIIENLW